MALQLLHPFVIAGLLIGAGVLLIGAWRILRSQQRNKATWAVWRWLRRAVLALGALSFGLGASYAGVIGYASWREQHAPSTQQALMLKDGRTIPLVQPTSAPLDSIAQPPANKNEHANPAGVTLDSAATSAPYLPPVRIKIARIKVDWPVVLSDNDHLSRFRGVGWFMGSAFPGAPGNIVLFGHLGGPYGTFMHLNELQPGDEVSVFTATGERRYRVRSSYETTPDDVAALAPSSTATMTLITCSGPWNAAAQTNERRLIVTADYIPDLTASRAH